VHRPSTKHHEGVRAHQTIALGAAQSQTHAWMQLGYSAKASKASKAA